MSEQYIGEIRYFPYFRGAPEGWLACDGSLQQISNYEVLYNLIGTTYGGDGGTTFGLPDLRGRVPIGASAGAGYPLGQTTGQETVTLSTPQMPVHNHLIQATGTSVTTTSPAGQVYGTGASIYLVPMGTPAPVAMANTAIGMAGQNQPHDNCAPTLPIPAFICAEGLYPQQP